MTADVLATQRARESVATVLTLLSQNIPGSASEGLINSLGPSDAYMRR